MTENIEKSYKERCKRTMFFYKKGQRKIDHDKVLEKSEECTKQILDGKKNYIPKMTKKVADIIYWTMLIYAGIYTRQEIHVLPIYYQ